MREIRAALVLPDVAVRNDFAALMKAELSNVDLCVHDPLSPGDVPPALLDAEVIFSFGQFLNDELLARSERLRWIQALGTGVDGIVDRSTLRDDVLITSARGVHRVCVSEAAFGLMIALARDLPRLTRAQLERRWDTGPSVLLYGRTVGILGVGVIAEGLAERCAAFGMRVEGISSRSEAPGFARLHRYEDLREAVQSFDFFVLLSPLTPQTRHIVNREVLESMKPDAFLVNVARGGVVDESALIEHLQARRIAGAALDVFAQEPLDPASPLWGMPNVFISPHAAGQHHDYAQQAMPIVKRNLAAYREGRREDLLNVVKRARR